MARVILCETKVATTSYIFPNTKIEVFSYEELCYYVYNNIALLSEEYIGKKLFDWIEKELEMEELALKLRVVKDKDSTGILRGIKLPKSDSFDERVSITLTLKQTKEIKANKKRLKNEDK